MWRVDWSTAEAAKVLKHKQPELFVKLHRGTIFFFIFLFFYFSSLYSRVSKQTAQHTVK